VRDRPSEREVQPHPLVVDMGAQPGQAEGRRGVGTVVQAIGGGITVAAHRLDAHR